jgi:hypothetical protein
MTPQGPPQAKVIKITQQQHIDGAGQIVREVWVEFTVGTHGPFVQKFDLASFDPNAVKVAIADFAQKIASLVPNG